MHMLLLILCLYYKAALPFSCHTSFNNSYRNSGIIFASVAPCGLICMCRGKSILSADLETALICHIKHTQKSIYMCVCLEELACAYCCAMNQVSNSTAHYAALSQIKWLYIYSNETFDKLLDTTVCLYDASFITCLGTPFRFSRCQSSPLQPV